MITPVYTPQAQAQAYAYHTDTVKVAHTPLHGGIGVYTMSGKTKFGTGTLSGIVIDKGTGARYLLSNQHVFFPTPAGEAVGTFKRPDSGNPVFQQADTKTAIGKTYATTNPRTLWPVSTKTADILPQITDYHDSALATTTLPVSFEVNQLGKQRGAIEPKVGMRIKMFGRTSGLQRGAIRKINNTREFKLAKYKNDKLVLKGECLADMYTQPGDSGSMIMNDDNRVVGIHYASPIGVADQQGHFCKATAVAKAYNVVFSEEEGPPPPGGLPFKLPDLSDLKLPKIDFSDKTTVALIAVGGFSLLLLTVGLIAGGGRR